MPRKDKKYYIIYKTTNILNDKFYIGMHVTNDLNDTYLGSGRKLKYSVSKYGHENHKFEILEFCINKEELKNREKEIVNEDLLKEKLCMNLKEGGEGGWSIEQQRKNGFKSNEKQIELRKNEEWRKKKKEKLSKSQKETYKKGRVIKLPDWNGKKHKEETKKKMSQTKMKNGTHKGRNNSQYGTCWIYNLIEKKNLKIKKEDLESWIIAGWIKGMKLNFNKKNEIRKGENTSQYGIRWIYNLELKKIISIKKEELENYLKLGWIKGRKIKF